jgi:hypothetical protein
MSEFSDPQQAAVGFEQDWRKAYALQEDKPSSISYAATLAARTVILYEQLKNATGSKTYPIEPTEQPAQDAQKIKDELGRCQQLLYLIAAESGVVLEEVHRAALEEWRQQIPKDQNES